MWPPAHAEVLATDWLPPVVLGRQVEVREVVRRLDPPSPRAPPPWLVGVAGPSGSGTSAVARRAAREVADRLREAAADPPRVVAVRCAGLRGTHGVVSAMLRRLDDGFDGRGFSVAEILGGFFRRLAREGRSTVLVLDDVGVAGPDLAPILSALEDPARYLVERSRVLPPVYSIVAGVPAALTTLDRSVPGSLAFSPFVALAPYPEAALGRIVADRGERALGRPLAAEVVAAIAGRAHDDGGGARRAVDLLRHQLLGTSLTAPLGFAGHSARLGVAVEPRVVHAIGAASRGVAAPVGAVRRLEAELARSEGDRPLPTTTLWRRIVRLEQAGYVRREIRPGGNGGTRSLLRVLTPIDEWVTTGRPVGTPRAFGPWPAASEEWGEDRGPSPSLSGLGLRPDVVPD